MCIIVTMEIQHEQTQSKGRFFISQENTVLAEMTYSKAGEALIIIDHTEVHDSQRGKGSGIKLVEAAIQHARAHKIKIMPLCPFAKAAIQKHPEWHDVLS